MAVRVWVSGALASLSLALLAITACGGSSATYAAAGVGLGATVLASGIHRAVTGACWANCAKGFYCDHASGLCQRGECDPSCREGEYCVKEANGLFRCAIPAGTYAFNQSKPPTSRGDANADAGSPVPLAVDAGASAESDSADAETSADGGAEAVPSADAGVDAAPPPP